MSEFNAKTWGRGVTILLRTQRCQFPCKNLRSGRCNPTSHPEVQIQCKILRSRRYNSTSHPEVPVSMHNLSPRRYNLTSHPEVPVSMHNLSPIWYNPTSHPEVPDSMQKLEVEKVQSYFSPRGASFNAKTWAREGTILLLTQRRQFQLSVRRLAILTEALSRFAESL
jgi:hypothetical protein